MNVTMTEINVKQRFSHLFQTAASHNQQGVHCLAYSDSLGAYRNLKLALQTMTQLTSEAEAGALHHHDQIEEVLMAVNDHNEAAALQFPTICMTRPVSLVPATESNCNYVYNHALLFCPPSPEYQHVQPDRSIAYCSVVILFNIALTFHQQNSIKALTMYEKVMELIQSSNSFDNDPELFLLHILARNNHTQLLSAHGQIQNALVGLKVLQEMIPVINDYALSSSSVLLVNDDVFPEVVLNVVVPGILQGSAPAA